MIFDAAINKKAWDFEKHRSICAACGDEAVLSVDIYLSREGVNKGGILTAFCQKCDGALTKLIDGFFEDVAKKNAVEVKVDTRD